MVYLEIELKFEKELKSKKIEYTKLNNRIFLSKETLSKNFKFLTNTFNLKKKDFSKLIFKSEMENLKKKYDRPKETLRLLKKMKHKIDSIKYEKIIGRKSNTLKPGEAKEYQKSIQFASSFIFVLFSSSLLGYYLGKEAFGWNYGDCLALSGIVAFITIVIEAFLFIIKMEKESANSKKRK